MKNNFEEILIFVVQLLVFYFFPIFAVNEDTLGMLVIVLLATFMLSLGMGGISKNKIKYYYPIIISILFVPAIYIYNNEFQLSHSLWCLLSSILGIIIGHIIMNK